MAIITFRHRVENTLTAATSVKLSNPTGTYGLKRVDTGEILVADGAAFTMVTVGVYRFSFTDPLDVPLYDYWVEVVYDKETNWLHRVQNVGEVATAPPPPVTDSTPNDCNLGCETLVCLERESPAFVRLRVRPTIRHGSTIEWLMHPNFADSSPHVFQLQVGHTGSNLADDWQNVGLPAQNATYLVDDTVRIFGKTQWIHYRVILTTPHGTYISRPQHTLGDVPKSTWQLILAREREWVLQLRNNNKGQNGFLLKRRLTGEKPAQSTDIIDYGTEEILRPQAEETMGTEFKHGYYEPIPCFYADLGVLRRGERIDSSRGSVNDAGVTLANMLGRPQIDREDVWINAKNDHRWQVHKIDNLEEYNDIPIIVQAELHLLPFSDVVYRIPMPKD